MKSKLHLAINLATYVSLIFALAFLLKQDVLHIPPITNKTYLFISILFLISGFLFQSATWSQALKPLKTSSTLMLAFCSTGKTIFTKYMPGKIWMLLSRAAYISKSTGAPLIQASALSTITQAISVSAGFTLGIFALYEYKLDPMLSPKITVFASTFLITTSLILSYYFCVKIEKQKTYSSVTTKQTTIVDFLRIFLYAVSSWGLWGIGFMFFIAGFNNQLATISISIFALSALAGIIFIFSPGGLGVREALMTTLLVKFGTDLALAISLSTLARLWFFSGELTIYLLAIVVEARCKKPKKSLRHA